jgi:Ala-tRNA(Pro) deacylase
MGMAMTLHDFLSNKGVDYQVLNHDPTSASMQTAEVAHIPGERLAKSVMLEDENGRYLMAVIPSNHHVDLGKLHREYNLHLGLATEQTLGQLFNDCILGAIPPVGEAYGIDVIMDYSLEECPDVYFEAGNHTQLVHVSGADFHRLMSHAKHGSISHHI